jgi:hypothetical protein
MQTSTLPELVQREGIPDNRPIFLFRRENGKGIIEFDLPSADEAKPPMSPEEALKQLEALQVDIGRPTNSTKIIRALRRDRYPRRARPRSVKRRKK